MNDIAKLLGTKNKKEQVQRVEALQQAVAIQPVDLIVRYDPRVNQVTGITAIGDRLTPDQIRIILQATEELLRKSEIEAAKLSTSEEEKEQDEG